MISIVHQIGNLPVSEMASYLFMTGHQLGERNASTSSGIGELPHQLVGLAPTHASCQGHHQGFRASKATPALVVSLVSVVYGALVFHFGTRGTARFFMSREPEIYQALKPRQES